MLLGGAVPVSAWIAALGHAASVVQAASVHVPVSLSSSSSSASRIVEGLVLPCTTLSVPTTNTRGTVVVIGAEAEVAAEAATRGLLYGAYHNLLAPNAVVAMWNGVISPASSATACVEGSGCVCVEVDGKVARPMNPDNAAHPATHFIFYSSLPATATASITEEDAANR